MSKITWFFRNIIHRINNLIDWFPVIWNDQDWDYHFFYIILAKKLERMESFFRSNKYCYREDNLEVAKKIHDCVVIANRLIKDNYLIEAMKPFDEEYPLRSIALDFTKSETHPGYYTYENRDTPDQKRLRQECYEKADSSQFWDRWELFENLKHDIESFWD